MMHTFIKKHSGLCALLAVLLGFAAAPYLLPENPDSAVFRSGTLGAMLLLAASLPLSQAFKTATRRELCSGFFWGFLFACALSVGSELTVYNGLLPGLGSMIRRLAVPLLALPLIGGLCTRLLLCRLPAGKTRHLPHWGYLLVILAGWLPLLLAYFPAAINYDFTAEYWQFLSSIFSNRHPLLYLIVNNAVILLGGCLFSRTFGLFLSTFFLHMLPFAAALAYSLTFLQKRKAPAWVLAALTGFYALFPIFSMLAISTSKDTVFSAALLTLSLLSYEMIEDPEAFFANKKRCALYVFALVMTAHLRNNGLFAFVLMIPALYVVLSGFRKQLSHLLARGLVIGLAITLLLNLMLPITSQPSKQLLSLPAQQLVRAYWLGDMTEEEKAETRSWFTEDYGLILHPHLADGAKGALDDERLEAHMDDFLSLWGRIGKKNPRVYTEAALMLNMGSWYPDDLSHSTVYQPSGLHVGYLETHRFDLEDYGINTYCLLPAVREWAERVCHENRYQQYPVLPYLFCTATPVWLLLLACVQFFARKKARFIDPALGTAGIWFSYLFGPCTLPRYVLPLFCLAPVLLLTAFAQSETKS